MSDPGRTTSAANLAKEYQGIEGFNILSRSAELCYVAKDTGVVEKETFPHLKDSAFEKAYPNLAEEVAGLMNHVRTLLACYLRSPHAGMELGYVLPVCDESRSWTSATLVLNEHVIEAFKAYEDYRYRKGLKDPFKTDIEGDKLEPMRSVQRGLDDLISHRDEFDTHCFFPVLFLSPEVTPSQVTADTPPESQESRQSHPLRVLNLLWSSTDESQSARVSPASVVFDMLRSRILDRGAIDRDQRVENRFSID